MEQFKPSDVEIQACFRHENIAELYGAILWDETIHLFMEAGEGGSVMEKLESCGPMREFEIIWVTKHILKGLDFLHSKRIIHHDIKRMCVSFLGVLSGPSWAGDPVESLGLSWGALPCISGREGWLTLNK